MMASRLFFLSKLSKRERQAVGLLRGSYPLDWEEADRSAVERLRTRAIGAGFSILDPASSCVSADEYRLLGWLALLQRQRPAPEIEINAGLRPFVYDCAHNLGARGIRLDYRVVAQLPGHAAAVPTFGCQRDRSPSKKLSRSSVQFQALLWASVRGTVHTREFKRLGVSRQIVNTMFKRGLLDRVHTGLYVAAPDAVALLGP